MSDTPRTKPQPVLLVMSVMAGVDAVLAGAALGDVISDKTLGLLLLIMVGFKVGSAYYLRGKVVPLVDVGAFVNDERHMVAGPAATVPEGTRLNPVSPNADH